MQFDRATRRELIKLLGGAVATRPVMALGQTKVFRIGMLETVSAKQKPADYAAFMKGLEENGYSEGRNILIEYRSADGRPERFAALARELVQLGVDVIVTRGTPAAVAAKSTTESIPIVMAAVGDPLLVVSSLARPGGNVTGLSSFVTDLMAKRVEILRELRPGLTRIAALLDMSNASEPPQWDEIKRASEATGMEARLLDVRTVNDLMGAFQNASEQRIDALILSIDTVTQTYGALIVELAMKHRILTIYPSREFVDLGGLIAYGVNYSDLYHRAASYAECPDRC